jgi:enterochelin esterase-like enzyme
LRRRLRIGAAVFVLMLSTGAVVTLARVHTRAVTAAAPQSLAISCRSPSLGGTLPAVVYLPAGYRGGTRRYPVVYFLHGLPATPSSYTYNGFVAAAVAAGARRAIVVAPQGARTPNSDREYLDWGPAENWPRAIASDLTRCTDAHFRTIAKRSGRALIGLSAGGFGAFNIGLRSLDTFGAIESWSGYFEATDPDGTHVLDLGSGSANQAARVPRDAGLDAVLAQHPTFIGFHVGRQDDRFLQDDVQFDKALTSHHVRHQFRTYPGGHSAALWRTEAPQWVDSALDSLSAR